MLTTEPAVVGGARDVASPELLARFGLLVERRFFGAAECLRICADMVMDE